MRARDVVGRRITGVRQERFWNEETKAWSVDVRGFELEDGWYIGLVPMEHEYEPYVHAQAYKREG